MLGTVGTINTVQTPIVVFVMGPTCAGKSTFLQLAEKEGKGSVGLVQVGKQLREKYSADYFKGSSNPEHTKEEAWELCKNGVLSNMRDGKRVILVDGQPRSARQVSRCIELARREGLRYRFLWITADDIVRRRRAESSRQGDALQLALDRMTGDKIDMYDVILTLNQRREIVHTLDTSDGLDDLAVIGTLSRMSGF